MLTPILFAALFPCLPSAAPIQGTQTEDSPFNTKATNSSWFMQAQEEREAQPIKNPKAAEAAKRACTWLAAHQNPDGSWSPQGSAQISPAETKNELTDDEFWDRALEGNPTDVLPKKTVPQGDPLHSIGVTGLAILALVEDGSTMTRGRHEAQLLKAVKYLVSQQDLETGLIGKQVGHAFHYDHAIATFAIAKVHTLDRPPALSESVQLAVHYIGRSRNPYGVWRYDSPPTGDNDSSVTTWMTLAVAEASKSGIKIDPQTFPSVIEWFNGMTEDGTGRVGYTERGSGSSRVPGKNEDFYTDPETLTAAGLVSRLACGQTPKANTVLVNHVRCILQALPSEEGAALTDAVWLYFGTKAMHEIGSRPFEKWSKAMIPLALAAQEAKGPELGSFPPQSVAWGFSTGRVGTTALAAAALHMGSR